MLDKVPLCINDEVLYFESVPGLFDLVEGMQCHLLEVSRPPVDRGALIDHVKVLRDADEIVLGHGGLFEQGLAMLAVRGQLATQPLPGSAAFELTRLIAGWCLQPMHPSVELVAESTRP